MKKFKKVLIKLCGLILLMPTLTYARLQLEPMPNLSSDDKPSLQRGARLYMNYCASCHSLQYLRYSRLSRDLAIPPQLVKDNLIFTDAGISETIHSAIPATDAQRWFGITPPDLSLIATVRGETWLYNFLRGFYADPKQPWGSNNWVMVNTAMPNVLLPLRGLRVAIYRGTEIDHLQTIKPGTMTPLDFDAAVADLVRFLHYASMPEQVERQHVGILILAFLTVLLILIILLRKALIR